MNFDCGVCGKRKDIVGFKDDGFVKGLIGVRQQIPMCQECKAESLKKLIDAHRKANRDRPSSQEDKA